MEPSENDDDDDNDVDQKKRMNECMSVHSTHYTQYCI